MDDFAAFIGWDWADKEHVLSVRERGRATIESIRLGGRPEDLHGFAARLLERFGGARVAIAIDAGRGAVISAFMHEPHIVLFPINPKVAASMREMLYPSGKKDDPVDSEALLELVEKHRGKLRRLDPADPVSRELGLLSEHRRKLDDDRKREVNRLRDALKSFYPQALELFEELSCPMACAFLVRWSSLEELQRANDETLRRFFRKHNSRSDQKNAARIALIRATRPLTDDKALVEAGRIRVRTLARLIVAFLDQIGEIETQIDALYSTHPDHDLIASFPGLGAVMGPRVVGILGVDRNRWDSAEALLQLSGIAPVTRRTGGTKGPVHVHRRVRRPKFMHQTFVEWAGYSVNHSQWARAYVAERIEKDPETRYYAILRSLAYKWIRILHRCWLTRTKYDEARYMAELARRGSPLAKRLPQAA